VASLFLSGNDGTAHVLAAAVLLVLHVRASLSFRPLMILTPSFFQHELQNRTLTIGIYGISVCGLRQLRTHC